MSRIRRTIEREDMLELTRRMNVSRSCFARTAGCYFNESGESEGTFNTNFLKLSVRERTHLIELAKKIPFAETNRDLLGFSYPINRTESIDMWKLLSAILKSEMKQDALLDLFYELAGEAAANIGGIGSAYVIQFLYGAYDVPVKAGDKAVLEESDEVYSFLICMLCPVDEAYTPSEPVAGFLFPAFAHRSSDNRQINVLGSSANLMHTLLGLIR